MSFEPNSPEFLLRDAVASRPAQIQIECKFLDQRATVPQYQSAGAAAFDLHACLWADTAELIVLPGEVVSVPTGLALWVRHPGLMLEVIARSGLGTRGLVLANGAGWIDSDYQGPLKCMMLNRSDEPIAIHHGDRFAQVRVVAVERAGFKVCDEFSDTTARGEGGFGSTGTGR